MTTTETVWAVVANLATVVALWEHYRRARLVAAVRALADDLAADHAERERGGSR